MSNPFGYPPYLMPDGSDWVQRLLALETSLQQLTDRVKRLEMQVEEVRSKPPIHVEYHFDQLKVNELKGTLNVGLSPQGVQGIDAFETPQFSWPPADAAAGDETPNVGMLQQQMMDFMDREAPIILLEMEREYGLALDDEHRNRILQDVKRQLRDRVHYYAKMTPSSQNGHEEDKDNWGQTVIDKTTRDIEAAFRAYLSGLKKSASGGGEDHA